LILVKSSPRSKGKMACIKPTLSEEGRAACGGNHRFRDPLSCNNLAQIGWIMTQTIPETPANFDEARIILRPDGQFYWQASDGSREYGPFPTLIAAVQDMQSNDENALEPGETLEEAESEIGISDWLDPDTGEPAEEARLRTEDH
jgi:hypothetical protein